MVTKSPLRWAGGKTQLLPQLLEILPKVPDGNCYYEPFLGGGAVFFELKSLERINKARLNDSNVELIRFYQEIRSDLKTVLVNLREHRKFHDESYFYELRSKNWRNLLPAAVAARLLYLNKAGFNGLYRLNRNGEFNVPWGKRTAESVLDSENLEMCSKLLQNTEIISADFEIALSTVKQGDVVYCDPPYLPIKPSSHTDYTQQGFGLVEHRRLAEVCQDLVRKTKAFVVVSNSDLPLTRELYQGFRVVEILARRSVAGKSDGRASVKELILVGDPNGF